MLTWYNSLDFLQKIYAYIAIPASAVMMIQTILLFLGIGDGSDPDIDGIDDISFGDDGLSLFTIRGIVAMLCVGGWSGIVMIEMGVPYTVTVLLSFLFGAAALFGMAMLIKLILKLQSSGNIDYQNAVGKVGHVYIPIPPNMTGTGKINVTFQDKYTELSAMSDEDEPLKTGEAIRVISANDDGILIVKRLYVKK